MHREDLKSGSSVVHHRVLEGMTEAVDIMSARLRAGESRLGEASLSTEIGREAWSGTPSMDAAIEVARFGWHEGREKLRKQIGSIAIDKLVGKRIVANYEYDYSGDEVDVDRYIAGNPENMVNYEFVLEEKGRVANLLINCTVSAYVSAEQIMKRGAAVLAAHDVLKAAGYSLGITMVETTSARSNGDIAEYKIPVVEPGGFLDEDTLAFCAAHPSFLRRLVFSINETENESLRAIMGFRTGSGYGMPSDVKIKNNTDIVIDKHEGLDLRSDEQILAYTQSIIERVEETLKINTADRPE